MNRRKVELPRLPHVRGGSFFQKEVQQILEPYHECNLPFGEFGVREQLESRATPIACFVACDMAAQNWSTATESSHLLWRFSHDPQLVADLLAAVTRYHLAPCEHWDLKRQVDEYEGLYHEDGRLMSWREVAERLNRATRTSEDLAERISVKEFPLLKATYTEILAKWADHIRAWRIMFRADPENW